MSLLDSCLLCESFLWRPDYLCSQCESDLLDFNLIRREVDGLEVFSLLHYFGAAERLVKLCKDPGEYGLLRRLALKAAEKLAYELVTPVAGVIPVPARIFGAHDHAYEVGESVSEWFDAPICNQFLSRRTLEFQKDKTLNERVQTRFSVMEPLIDLGKGLWIIADDVVTSGATLSGAWRALGKPRAVGLAIASTPRLRDFVPWP